MDAPPDGIVMCQCDCKVRLLAEHRVGDYSFSLARDLARIFAVPPVEIDVGTTNGATFSVSGVERGWGSATPGRAVQTMLRERLANPVVILDEVDKIPN